MTESITEQIQEYALKAFNAISAKGMARVDFFFQEADQSIWINEINTLPGFTSQSMYPMLWDASGIKLEKLVAELVSIARE